MKIGCVIVLLLFPAVIQVRSQTLFPGKDYVFEDSYVPKIDISIEPEYLEAIFADPGSNTEYPADFIFTTPAGSDTVTNVGFRLRGNTSRNAAKKSYKVSFNTFEKGRKFHGLEKMNINGEHNDPSLLRSKLCWDMMRFMKVPASRASHVRLYINGGYYGLYVNVEHIDEQFTASRFGDNLGNLYKCLWPADLQYLGSDPESYKFEDNDRRTYDLHTNREYQDYRDLVALITDINTTGDGDFACRLGEAFDVDAYLRVAAVDVLTGNWDNYSYLMNNYYLYLNPPTGKMEFIPYDMDNTFGVDWFGVDWAERDIYAWQSDDPRPLYTRIMAVPGFRDRFSYYLDYLLDHYVDTDSLANRMQRLHDMIRPCVVDDPFYSLDYGYSMDDFDASLTSAAGDHVKYGIGPFVAVRNGSARAHLTVGPMAPMVTFLEWNGPDPDDTLRIFAGISDDDLSGASLFLAENGSEVVEYPMEETDDSAGGGILERDFRIEIPLGTGVDKIEFFVRTKDQSGHTTDYPCNSVSVDLPYLPPDLIINEFMALNQTFIADEYGEYDDWIELYNRGSEKVWLGDKFLSDNLEDRDEWKLPGRYLDPGQFLLVWADGEEEQGSLHAGFRLDTDSEEIGLFDAPSTGFRPIDHVAFGPQATDRSYSRVPDGSAVWMVADAATPMGITGRGPFLAHGDGGMSVYPNPAGGNRVWFSRNCTCRVYDAQGRKVGGAVQSEEMEIGSLVPGLYIIVFDSGERVKLLRE